MNCRQQEITDAFLISYKEVGGINHIDCANLPSKPAVERLCLGLLQILFPGFHDDEPISSDELEMITTERIFAIMKLLAAQISRSLHLRDTPPLDALSEAHEIVCNFFHKLPRCRQLLSTDVIAAYDGDPAAKSYEEIILSYPFIETIAIQRCAHELYNGGVPLLPRIMTEWSHSRTGIDIHPGAKIGPYFFIDHGTGVVIGETCIIGAHVKLYHGVTLGARSFPKDDSGHIVKGKKRHPNVEDGVVIYPNATVLGGETVIGAGSTIGGNVFLIESTPPNSFVTTPEANATIRNKRTHVQNGS